MRNLREFICIISSLWIKEKNDAGGEIHIASVDIDELLCGSEDKASACNAGDLGSIPGLGRSPGEGNGKLLQYS